MVLSTSASLPGLDEWRLRTLAESLRPLLDRLVGEEAAFLDRQLSNALDLAPGRAKVELRRLLLMTSPPITAWASRQLGLDQEMYRHVDVETGRTPHDLHDLTGRQVDARSLTFTVSGTGVPYSVPLTVGDTYIGTFGVGDSLNNLFRGETAVVTGEVPAGGLDTDWLVFSKTMEFAAPDPGVGKSPVVVGTAEAGDQIQYLARFSLHIPARGPSETRILSFTPLTGPQVRLDAEIRVGNDVYRRLTATVNTAPVDAAQPAPTSTPPRASVSTPAVFVEPVVAAEHVNLRPNAPWQQAPRTLHVTFVDDAAVVFDDQVASSEPVHLALDSTAVDTAIRGVRLALDAVRRQFGDGFEPSNPDAVLPELARFNPSTPWWGSEEPDDDGMGDFVATQEKLATSQQLRRLASQGHLLYSALFPPRIRAKIETLGPGDRIMFTWHKGSSSWVPDLPLPLLHLLDPPARGEPVHPSYFFGLRYRLGYVNQPTADNTRSLGDWTRTTRAHLVYWGDDQGDDVGRYAARHLEDLQTWTPLKSLPAQRTAPSIDELASFLRDPSPAPVSLLYFYCHCKTDDGVSPVLRFGPTNAPSDQLEIEDLALDTPIAGAPVAFVNACASQVAGVGLSNSLVRAFLARGCRAFVGSETEVPAGFASAFALAFFRFLYGGAGQTRAPVGESIAQARRFFWLRERNLGGLFYNFVNDYQLYAADHETVAKLSDGLRAGPRLARAANPTATLRMGMS